jgi:hypothetical protein
MRRWRARGERGLHAHSPMAKPRFNLTLASAALALIVLGCRSDERSARPDESSSPDPMSQTEPLDPEATDENHAEETRDQHTWGSAREVPTAVEPETDPVDPDMPEAVDPGADPKQPPPPSNGGAGA